MNWTNQFSPRKAASSKLQTIFPTRLLLLLTLAMLTCNAFGQNLTILYSFGAIKEDGTAPGSGVIVDKSGNLFGTTGVTGSRFNGTVFELSPPALHSDVWTETIIHRFHGTPDGRSPLSRPVMMASGALAGTTSRGGADDLGIAYNLLPPVAGGNWKRRIIHSFGIAANDVVTPDLGLLPATEGLYGVDQGGANNTGAFYLLTPPARGLAWTQHILYNFQAVGSNDAAFPGGELIRDANGNFYGVSVQGGANNLGAVYEISPPARQGDVWTEAVIYSFNGTDGTLPAGPLLFGPNGVLYGTAEGGGDNGAGLVFELDPPSADGNPWSEIILHTFNGGTDGTSPATGVIPGPNGTLLGTAGGTVFMLTPPQSHGDAWTETVLHSFSLRDGFIISSPITLFDNALYGTTAQGGTFGKGTVFQLTLP
jgi:uncharacterized repeat protein (TIGR03803 family)